MYLRLNCSTIPNSFLNKNFHRKINFDRFYLLPVAQWGKGQNYENHNVENQKELRKLRRQSEHRKD